MTQTEVQIDIANRYVLLEPLGRGGMGVVYRALDRLSNQHVALKRVTTPATQLEFSTKGDFTDLRVALAQEFRTLGSLRHPHIISVLDYGFDSFRQPFFTMELLSDIQTITQFSQDKSYAEQCRLIAEMLLALQYLHRNSIIHRDIKPSNVVVDDGKVRILDFGLAIARENQADATMPVGTLAYMAPEVLLGGQPTAATDLFAVGIVAYEMFAGKHPYANIPITDMLENILYKQLDTTTLPVAEPMRNVIKRLAEKEPANRYRSISDIFDTLQLEQSEDEQIRESFLKAAQFVGRNYELVQLNTALDKAQDGKGSAILIGGESGIGKSRLLDELRIQALVSDTLVLRVQCTTEVGQPYQIWRNMLRQLTLNSDISNEDAIILRDVVPDISALLQRDLAEGSTIDTQIYRARLLSAIEHLFKNATKPIALLIEDLQWANDDLTVLQHLLNFVASVPLLIVATYRSDESPDLPDTLSSMIPIQLSRLNEDEIETLSISMLGTTGTNRNLQDLLQRETEGNVFFIIEVMRTLAENSGQLNAIGRTTLPPSVVAEGIQMLVTRRLNTVPKAYRPLLEIAAVAGRELNLDLLSSIAPDTLDLDAWLTTCARVAVLEAQENTWRFAHDKLRERLLNKLSDSNKQDLHAKVASSIEVVFPNDMSYAARLAYHWQAGGNSAKEAFYAAEAGHQALQTASYPLAKQYLERALVLENKTTDKQFDPTLVRLWLGDVVYHLGDYERSETLLRDSIALAKEANSTDGLARAHNILGNISLAVGRLAEADTMLKEAVAIGQATNDKMEVGKATRSLGVIAETNGDDDAARRYYTKALKILSDIDDTLGLAGTYSNLASLARNEGDYQHASQLYEQALKRFEAIDFQWGLAYTATNYALILDKLERYDDAMQQHIKAVNICERIGHRWGQAYTNGNLARTALNLKNFSQARTAILTCAMIAIEINTIPLALDALCVGVAWLLTKNDAANGFKLYQYVMAQDLTEEMTKREFEPLGEKLASLLDKDMQRAMMHITKTMKISDAIAVIENKP